MMTKQYPDRQIRPTRRVSKAAEVTERRAVMLARLRGGLYGLATSSNLCSLPADTSVMVTGGDYTTLSLEVTVPGTQRRICVMHHEVMWDELMVGDGVLRGQVDRNLAYYDAWCEHPRHKQELMRRRAMIVREMHGQYAAPSLQMTLTPVTGLTGLTSKRMAQVLCLVSAGLVSLTEGRDAL